MPVTCGFVEDDEDEEWLTSVLLALLDPSGHQSGSFRYDRDSDTAAAEEHGMLLATRKAERGRCLSRTLLRASRGGAIAHVSTGSERR